jgi:GntR family transcriptional regulator
MRIEMVAKYERVAQQLKDDIRSGKYAEGTQLPAETVLADQLRVSLPTFRRGLDVLRAEGLIVSVHGIGTFVRKPRQPVRRTPERYQWEKDRVHLSEAERLQTGATEKDTGLTFSDLEFSVSYDDNVIADEQIAEDFDIPVGTRMLRRNYATKSRHEDAPVSQVTSYLVYDVASQNPDLLDSSREPWPGGTQHQLSTIGIEVASITDAITTRPPTGDESEALGISPQGVSVFRLRKTSVDTTGRVVEVSYVILPGDRTEFVYVTHLSPWGSK